MLKITALFGRPAFLKTFHAWAAWLWFLLGIGGLGQYVWLMSRGEHTAHAIAASIPVLFFISIYANTVGHWSSNQAAKVEVKQDQQINEAASNTEPTSDEHT